MQLQYNTIQFC